MYQIPDEVFRSVVVPMLGERQVCRVLPSVCRLAAETTRFAIQAFYDNRRRRLAQMLMFYEDARRFCEHTLHHLESFCTHWEEKHIIKNPWWGRPPCKERGAFVDALDFQKSWCPAQIIDWRDEVRIYPPLAPCSIVHEENALVVRPPVRVDTRTIYHVRFLGWHRKWDEWLPARDIRPFGSQTVHPVRRRVAARKQWMLDKYRGVWDIRLVHPHAVASAADAGTFFPVTDVLAGLLVEEKGLYGIRL